MVLKKLLTDVDLLDLLDDAEDTQEASSDPVLSFLAFYGIEGGEESVTPAALRKLYEYKYGKVKNPKELTKKFGILLPRTKQCFLLNKSINQLFEVKTEKKEFNFHIENIRSFYGEYEIEQGNELILTAEELLQLLSVWCKKKRKKYSKRYAEYFDKFFNKKDTKNGILYTMKSEKLKELKDEQEEKNQKG